QELCRLLRGQLGHVGDDVDPLAVRQEPQDLGEQDSRFPRDDQSIITRELTLELDRISTRMSGQVLADTPSRAQSQLRVATLTPCGAVSLTGHVRTPSRDHSI